MQQIRALSINYLPYSVLCAGDTMANRLRWAHLHYLDNHSGKEGVGMELWEELLGVWPEQGSDYGSSRLALGLCL